MAQATSAVEERPDPPERLAALRLLLLSLLMLRDNRGRRVLKACSGGQVCLVATSIWGASEIRRRTPPLMGSLTDTVAFTVRRTLAPFAAAEVQCDCDGSLLLAFAWVEDALRWTIAFFDALGQMAWPAEVLKAAECRPVEGTGGHLLFNGPRIQLGIAKGKPDVKRTLLCDRFLPSGSLVAQVRGLLHVALEGEIVVGSSCYADVTTGKLFNEGAISLTDRGEYMIVNGEAQLVRSLCTAHTFRRQSMYQLAGRASLRAAISVEDDMWMVLPSATVEHRHSPRKPISAPRRMETGAPPTPTASPQLLEALAEALGTNCSGDADEDAACLLQAVKWLRTERQWMQQELRKHGVFGADFEGQVAEAQRASTFEEDAIWRTQHMRELEEKVADLTQEKEALQSELKEMRRAAADAAEQTPAFLQKQTADLKEGFSLFFRRTKTADFSDLLLFDKTQLPLEEPIDKFPPVVTPPTGTQDAAGRLLEKQGIASEPQPTPKAVNIPAWLRMHQQGQELGLLPASKPSPTSTPISRRWSSQADDCHPPRSKLAAKFGGSTLTVELPDPYDITFSKKGTKRGSQPLPLLLEDGNRALSPEEANGPMIVLSPSSPPGRHSGGFEVHLPSNRLSVNLSVPDDPHDRPAQGPSSTAPVLSVPSSELTAAPPPPSASPEPAVDSGGPSRAQPLPRGATASTKDVVERPGNARSENASVQGLKKCRPVTTILTAAYASKASPKHPRRVEDPSHPRPVKPPFRSGGVLREPPPTTDLSMVEMVKGWTAADRKRFVYLGWHSS
eukprot:GGOE01002039.1.p1 GENE.GGOE01002039.1~~GGOE01002039.1.p1  ORF type:complete len:789 (-),score=184.95 GGOE01002039.1:217-2583(-)